MLRPDITSLNHFYDTRLGWQCRRLVRAALRQLLPSKHGESLLALGYGLPYVKFFQENCHRLITFMPAAQGAVHWPREGASCTALCDEVSLPLADQSMDQVLLIHLLEHCSQPKKLLREAWRVLKPNGCIVLVVPNRRGLWARFDHTPFGQGLPYTLGQVEELLKEVSFTIEDQVPALFSPPLRSRIIFAMASSLERLGREWLPRFGGVYVIRARKEIYNINMRKFIPTRVIPWPVGVFGK